MRHRDGASWTVEKRQGDNLTVRYRYAPGQLGQYLSMDLQGWSMPVAGFGWTVGE